MRKHEGRQCLSQSMVVHMYSSLFGRLVAALVPLSFQAQALVVWCSLGAPGLGVIARTSEASSWHRPCPFCQHHFGNPRQFYRLATPHQAANICTTLPSLHSSFETLEEAIHPGSSHRVTTLGWQGKFHELRGALCSRPGRDKAIKNGTNMSVSLFLLRTCTKRTGHHL